MAIPGALLDLPMFERGEEQSGLREPSQHLAGVINEEYVPYILGREKSIICSCYALFTEALDR